MLEKSLVPYITKSSINCIIIAGSAGLIYNYQLDFKQRILLLLQKTSNISGFIYNYYTKIIEFNKNLYHKFLFFVNENKKYKTYVYMSIPVIGISSIIYKKNDKISLFLTNTNNMIIKKIKAD